MRNEWLLILLKTYLNYKVQLLVIERFGARATISLQMAQKPEKQNKKAYSS